MSGGHRGVRRSVCDRRPESQHRTPMSAAPSAIRPGDPSGGVHDRQSAHARTSQPPRDLRGALAGAHRAHLAQRFDPRLPARHTVAPSAVAAQQCGHQNAKSHIAPGHCTVGIGQPIADKEQWQCGSGPMTLRDPRGEPHTANTCAVVDALPAFVLPQHLRRPLDLKGDRTTRTFGQDVCDVALTSHLRGGVPARG